MATRSPITIQPPRKEEEEEEEAEGKGPTSEIMGDQQQQPPPSSPAANTTLTKVFVGGLAWETQREVLRDYFHKFGDIIEAVIITDKLTGRSKGYGFVTFKEAEAAKKACEDAAPVINGRKANCNLAFLGARRGGAGKISPPATPAPLPSTYSGGAGCGGAANAAVARPAAAPVPWYFPVGTSPSSPSMSHFHHHYPAGVLPFYATAYGYSPSYLAPTNMGYRTKANHSGVGGAYISGHYSYPAQGGGMVAPISVTPMYHPMYQFHHNNRLPDSMGGIGMSTAHFVHPATAVGSVIMPTAPTSKLPAVPAATAASHTRLASAEAF